MKNKPDAEKSEMLTVYDEDLNPVGERTRADVHANGLLHRTIRLWTIADDRIWFQKRSMDKALFPGRLDLSATGHVDPGEAPLDAALRETREEIGLDLDPSDVMAAGAIPFPFTRPDGRLDNEFASVYLYAPDAVPAFRPGGEVAGIASIHLAEYGELIRSGRPAAAELYRCDPEGKRPPTVIGGMEVGPDDLCCPNAKEWKLVGQALTERQKAKDAAAKATGRDIGMDAPSTEQDFQI